MVLYVRGCGRRMQGTSSMKRGYVEVAGVGAMILNDSWMIPTILCPLTIKMDLWDTRGMRLDPTRYPIAIGRCVISAPIALSLRPNARGWVWYVGRERMHDEETQTNRQAGGWLKYGRRPKFAECPSFPVRDLQRFEGNSSRTTRSTEIALFPEE